MKCCLFLFLFHLEMCPLQGQSPSSDQGRAKVALRAQVSQIGNDCPSAKTTMEENSCISIAEQQTKRDFATFYGSLQSLLRQRAETGDQLNSSQEYWEHYAQKACEAIDSFSRRGTIHPSAAAACRIQLTRSRMQDLDALYNTTLHH